MQTQIEYFMRHKSRFIQPDSNLQEMSYLWVDLVLRKQKMRLFVARTFTQPGLTKLYLAVL